MHYHCEIWLPEIPENTTLEELIQTEMAPFIEEYNEETEELSGWWDWYALGGRWTGAHDGYEPAKDPANYAPCKYCSGTGVRPGSSYFDGTDKPGCNVCNNKYQHTFPGQALNFRFQPHAGDIIPISQLSEDFTCYRLIAGERMYIAERFNDELPPGEKFETIWDGNVKKVLGDARGFLVTVDYHC